MMMSNDTIQPRQSAVNKVFSKYKGCCQKPTSTIPPIAKKEPQLPKGILPEDKELLKSIRGFKDWNKIKAMANNTGIYGEGDFSAHDQALCNKLAFYTGKDPAQMDRIFRASKRYRSKWDELRGSFTYGEITITKAIEDTKETYKGPRPKQSTGRGGKPVATLEGLQEAFGVTDEYVQNLGEEEFLYPNLIIRNHILTIIAQSGGGKTTFLYFHVVPELVKAGCNVWYIDADSPPSDHKKMKEVADKHGFEFLIPDVNQGTSVESMIETIEKMANDGVSLDNQVFFFDTLKKFIDLMSKKSAKDFFVLMRKLTKLGATIVLPGHANKHRDYDENLVFEGVGDVRSDTDDLIYFEMDKKPDGSIDVTTVVDSAKGAKVRGIFKSFSFNISKERSIKVYDNPLEPSNVFSTGSSKATDDEIVEAAMEYLKSQTNPVKQTELIENTVALLSGKTGTSRATKAIKQHAVQKGDPLRLGSRFVYTIGDKNSHHYELSNDESAQEE